MNRKKEVCRAMQSRPAAQVILTDEEKQILEDHGTTHIKYLAGEQPQTFVIHGTTDDEQAKAEALEAVISKMDRITGKSKPSIVIFIKGYTGEV